ncbi:MAG TPA: hypothetical protein VLZ83_00400 [Edaphocola sp.]|nr:hypothetical protein [Edaphocola sp.]
MSKAIFLLMPVLFLISCSSLEGKKIDKMGIHIIEVKKGRIFTFQLPQNKSMGYEICWINEPKMSSKFVLKDHKSKFRDVNNIDRGGEDVRYDILALETGTDTLIFKNCPTRIWQKECEFFAVDSVRTKTDSGIVSTYTPKQEGDYELIIKVTE